MVHVLNPQAKNQIQRQLTRYFFMSLSLSVLFILCTLYFHFVTVREYNNIIDQNLCLNRFYSELEQQNSNIGLYWQDNLPSEAAAEQVYLDFNELSALLDRLENQSLGKNYNRNIRDMKELLKSYQTLFSSLCIKTNALSHDQVNASLLSEVNVIYFEMQEIYAILYSDFGSLQLAMLENMEEVHSILNMKTFAYVLLLITALGLMMILGVLQAKKLTSQVARPILTLAHSAEMILDGKIDEFERIPVNSPDDSEITLLTNAFNLIIEQIRSYISEIKENASAKVALVEKELENLRISNLLKSSEMKVLQMQINPHFLFNTLNMIAQTAYVGDSDTTVFLLGKTAELLRYSLGSMGKTVTLARELSMLGNYIYLQEQRMGDRIEFEFDLDERFHQMQVPCLILQPLIENAITHGVGTYTENGRVLIRTQYDDERRLGIISIGDNGLGMSPERIQELQQELCSPDMQMEKIGLANVYMRLQLLYDQKAQIEISSTPRVQTEIRLLLPCELGDAR